MTKFIIGEAWEEDDFKETQTQTRVLYGNRNMQGWTAASWDLSTSQCLQVAGYPLQNCMFSVTSSLLKTPEPNLRSTRHSSVPRNPQSNSVSQGKRPREKHIAMSPLFVGLKTSDGMLAD